MFLNNMVSVTCIIKIKNTSFVVSVCGFYYVFCCNFLISNNLQKFDMVTFCVSITYDNVDVL